MAEEVVATFSGPLDSFSINLTIDNASNSDVREFGISGRTARFPVTWDSFGSLAGPVTATATNGVDTEVVMVHLSNFSRRAGQLQRDRSGLHWRFVLGRPGP